MSAESSEKDSVEYVLSIEINRLRGMLNDLLQDYEQVCGNLILRQPYASTAFKRASEYIEYRPVSTLR